MLIKKKQILVSLVYSCYGVDAEKSKCIADFTDCNKIALTKNVWIKGRILNSNESFKIERYKNKTDFIEYLDRILKFIELTGKGKKEESLIEIYTFEDEPIPEEISNVWNDFWS